MIAGLRRRFFAWMYRFIDRPQRRMTADVRRALISDLRGSILEVGCGLGANFAHYAPDTHVVAIDANPHMLKGARDEARRAEGRIEVALDDACDLGFEDASFDAYVAGLVLCSVPDLDRAVSEAMRVLRPGGTVRLFEHVRSGGTWGVRLQRWLNPAWGVVADGCHLDRDPAGALRAAGFDDVDVSVLRRSGGLMPMVTIRATKLG